MIVIQKATGLALTLRGDFREPLTASARVASFRDPAVASLVSTVEGKPFESVCRQFGIAPETVVLSSDRTKF